MNSLVSPENIFSGLDKPTMVIYVENAYNAELNAFIQENYHDIVTYYAERNIDFCYLPYLLRNEKYLEIVNYNRPYLNYTIDDEIISRIYHKVLNQLRDPFKADGLIFCADIVGYYEPVFGIPINEESALMKRLQHIANVINEFLQEQLNEKIDSKVGGKPSKDSTESIDSEPEVKENFKEYDSGICFKIIDEDKDADSTFGYEVYRLADEIRNNIQQLSEAGALKLIDDIIEEIQGKSKKLSILFITNDYRIFLKDYGMREVVMTPLPKSLFILFLRHPEGILFKQLSDYHDELLSIYRNVTVHENIDRAIESIRAMTDPLNNSINEKCSRIRAAFLEVIADDLAQKYYVTGYRGEPKKITLDRSLVEFQK